MSKALPSPLRRDALRTELPRVADLLRHRRAGEIDACVIDELVELSWLEWFGGSLQLTATGANICQQQAPTR
jgi:hypothetical protein